MDAKEYLTFRIPKKVMLYIYILLCVFVVVIAYNNWPRYVVLNPPVPNNGFVVSEGKTIYNPNTASGEKLEGHNTWTWRRKYGFFPKDSDTYTSEAVLSYFDAWLNEHEWKKFEGQESACSVMAKADLPESDSNISTYVPENTTGSYYSSVVCLAAWPYTTKDNQTGFTVLLFTATK